jgi:hypothetical protein
MDSSHFQKFYEFEIDQRNAIATTVNIPLVVMAALTSAVSIVLVDYQYQYTIQCYLFGVTAGASLLSLLCGLYFLCRAAISPNYKKLPNPKALREHSFTLKNWRRRQGLPVSEADALSKVDFEEYLNELLADAAAWNGNVNRDRGAYVQRALLACACAVVVLIPSGGLYVFNKVSSTDKIYSVQLLGKPNICSAYSPEPAMSNNLPDVPASTPQPERSQPPATAPVPTPAPFNVDPQPPGPANEFFKTHTISEKPAGGKDSK